MTMNRCRTPPCQGSTLTQGPFLAGLGFAETLENGRVVRVVRVCQGLGHSKTFQEFSGAGDRSAYDMCGHFLQTFIYTLTTLTTLTEQGNSRAPARRGPPANPDGPDPVLETQPPRRNDWRTS